MVAVGESEPPDNVLLIILDTVRARSSYPINTQLTPTIKEIGDAGTCFHQAITPAPWTLPAHTSMFTGRYPTEHGVTTFRTRLGPSRTTLAQYLAEAGLQTGLFTSNAWLTDTYGLSQGFSTKVLSQSDHFKLYDEGIDFFRLLQEEDAEFRTVATDSILENPSFKNIANLLYVLYKEFLRHVVKSGNSDIFRQWDAQTVTECQGFIRKNVAEDINFFAVVNLVQAHSPWKYDPKRLKSIGVNPSAVASDETWHELAENSTAQVELAVGDIHFDKTDEIILTSLYKSSVYSSDQHAEEIIQTLQSENIRDNTLVIMTSDHGESIGRDDVLGHSVTLHRDVTHVPLVMDGPGIPNIDVREIVSLKDIFGTVLDSFNIESHSPSLFEEDGQGVALSETDGADAFENKDRLDHYYGKRRAIFTGENNAEIRYGSEETVGPKDLIEKLDSIVSTLEDQQVETHEEAEVRESIKSQLEKLGYLKR